MNLAEKINEISLKIKNKCKPDLVKYGKNFRAISESAILEELNPLLKEYNLYFRVYVNAQKLNHILVNAGTDVVGNIVQVIVFVADCVVRVVITDSDTSEETIFEGWGSGIDSGDKATGKAMTAAFKYALLKGFRLQYSDDPDAEMSERIESLLEEKKSTEKTSKDAKEKSKSRKKEDEEDLPASEKQLDYIASLCSSMDISDEDFKKKFKHYPYDQKMPMKTARAAIDYLKKALDESLPF